MNDTMVVLRVKKTFPALSYRNFRLFWFGQCISLVGTWMQFTAQQWLVYTMTKSAFLLGLLGVAQFGPVMCLSLFAGVVVDRYPKRSLLLLTQTFLMIQAFTLGILVWSGHIVYGAVLFLAAVQGLINALDLPTRLSFISELVETKDLRSAIGLNSAIFNVARMVGPAIAAVLIVKFGPGPLFLLNAVTFFPVLIGLYLIKTEAEVIKKIRKKVLTEVLEGLSYIRQSSVLLCTILSVIIFGTFVMNLNLIIPIYTVEVLRQGVYGFGFISSAVGAGSLVAALYVASNTKGNPRLEVLFGSAFLVSTLFVILNFIHSMMVAAGIFILIGFFNIIFATTANATLQLNSNEQFRGRVLSVYSFAFVGTTPIGNLFAGSITEKLGSGMGFLTCGVFSGFFIGLIVIAFFMRQVQAKSV